MVKKRAGDSDLLSLSKEDIYKKFKPDGQAEWNNFWDSHRNLTSEEGKAQWLDAVEKGTYEGTPIKVYFIFSSEEDENSQGDAGNLPWDVDHVYKIEVVDTNEYELYGNETDF